jgi:hypothetical protein
MTITKEALLRAIEEELKAQTETNKNFDSKEWILSGIGFFVFLKSIVEKVEENNEKI